MTSHDLRHLKGLPSMGVLNCIVVEDNNKQSADAKPNSILPEIFI